MTIIRVWKRNGDRNSMELRAAVDNLMCHCTDIYVRLLPEDERRTAIRRQLLDGAVLSTRHALFGREAALSHL